MGAVLLLAGVMMLGGDAPTLTRVRGGSPDMHRLIAEAATRSAAMRGLVDEIQRSQAMVVVQFGLCAKGRVRSCVSAVQGDATHRHIRILIDTRTTGDRLMATIAHELQHAVEILRDPGAVDADTTLRLYRQIAKGQCGKGLSERCETEAALAVESQVLEQIHRSFAQTP